MGVEEVPAKPKARRHVIWLGRKPPLPFRDALGGYTLYLASRIGIDPTFEIRHSK